MCCAIAELYQSIMIPVAVADELRSGGAPAVVRHWISNLPEWVNVRSAPVTESLGLEHLDKGEIEAISLAQDLNADILLIDEREGCKQASRLGLATTGTLGVLLIAGLNGLVNAEDAYQRLIAQTNFRSSSNLEKQFLALARHT